jgi:hypothetical protein
MTEEKFIQLFNQFHGLNISELTPEAKPVYEFVKFCAEAHLKHFKRKSREQGIIVVGVGAISPLEIFAQIQSLKHEPIPNQEVLLQKEKTYTLTKPREFPELNPYVDDQFSRKKYPKSGGPIGAIEKKRKH